MKAQSITYTDIFICAEIISVMLRPNRRIQGIKIEKKEYLLSDFSDDTNVCLDGSEESLTEYINTLEAFTLIAGLKMNNKATQIV